LHGIYSKLQKDRKANATKAVVKTRSIFFGITILGLPSGKRLHSYGQSPFLMGKPSINGHFQ
jgi:hypothetical protein